MLDEECGDRAAAAAGFEQVLAVDPDYSDALARLAGLDQVTEPQAGIVERLQTALGNSRDPRQQENLHYALGKAFDDLGNYRAAFEHYHQANLLTRKRSGAYQRQGTEQLFQAILEHSASAEAAAITPVSTARPIFICGMFRSGSTLLEQMLAAHSALRAGGENRFFLRHAPLPETLSLPAGRLSALGREYLESLGGSIAELGKVTNKRPDNFLHLGWLLRCFPNARVLYTHRDAMDVCLSVHFQAFAEDLGYDSDLLDIGHYYIQQHRLMEQMQARYPENIHPVDYDKLIQEPRSELEPVLSALGPALGGRLPAIPHPGQPGEHRQLVASAAATLSTIQRTLAQLPGRILRATTASNADRGWPVCLRRRGAGSCPVAIRLILRKENILRWVCRPGAGWFPACKQQRQSGMKKANLPVGLTVLAGALVQAPAGQWRLSQKPTLTPKYQ